MPRHLHSIYSLTVSSEISLPDLPEVEALATATSPTVAVNFGSVPEMLSGAEVVKPTHQVAGRTGDMTCLLLTVPDVARYLLEVDRRSGFSQVTVDTCLPRDASILKTFLIGTIFGTVMHLRGLFALHASAVRIGDGTVAFCGPSNAGKSTLAAALVARGHLLVSDDVCVIDTAANGPVVCLPGPGRIKLWPEVLQPLGWPDGTVDEKGPPNEKIKAPCPSVSEPAPLLRVYEISAGAPRQPAVAQRITGPKATTILLNNVYRSRIANGLGLRQQIFEASAAIADRCQVHRLSRRKDFDALDETIDLILREG